ncbi:MAG: lytic transglycosylase domain-containing protein [Bdellovibrionales bacterium]
MKWISLVVFNYFLLVRFAFGAELPLSFTPPTINETDKIVLDTKINPTFHSVDESPHFDLPVTYNSKVRYWINFYQTNGKNDFKKWLERSSRYIPKIIPILEKKGLPRDLVYLAMIESGFSSHAVSTADAVGYWQFIKPTASRYGLKIDWWLDERKDIVKSTVAAATYLNDLHRMFKSWYLAVAGYNMGEGRIRNLIIKNQTKNFWVLSQKKGFPQETEQYIPKLIAAMLIAKTPKIYGFRDIVPQAPIKYDFFNAPGGLDLQNLSLYLGVDRETINKLNPEIIKGFIPQYISNYTIRIPQGHLNKAKQFARSSLVMSN